MMHGNTKIKSVHVFYIMQSMAASWYKKCDGQKREKNKYVNPLVDSGHYILFVDTHVCTRDRKQRYVFVTLQGLTQ